MKRSLLFSCFVVSGLSVLAPSAQASIVSADVLLPLTRAQSVVDISSKATASVGAEKFVRKLADQGIGLLENKNLSKSKQKSAFRSLLNKNFDMNTIARFSLGRYWRSASKVQRDEYLRLFKKMIVEVYSDRFKEYEGQKIEVLGSRKEGERDILVHSKLQQPDGPDVKVDWRVRNRDGHYKVIDVIVEGVSMALTQRSDFSSVVQRGGGNMEALLVHLRQD